MVLHLCLFMSIVRGLGSALGTEKQDLATRLQEQEYGLRHPSNIVATDVPVSDPHGGASWGWVVGLTTIPQSQWTLLKTVQGVLLPGW